MVDKAIIIFLIVTIACMVVITIYLVKLIISSRDLVNSANAIANSVQKEIEPTLQELKEAAKSINSIANNADKKFQNAKTGVAALIGAGLGMSGKLKEFGQGIMKGISFGLKMFKK